MTAWFVVAVPVLIMFFALAMERLENRLRHLTVQENEVEEFLQAARPEEVRVLFGSGIGGALELFRRRRRPSAGTRTGSPTVDTPRGKPLNGAGPPDGTGSREGTGSLNGAGLPSGTRSPDGTGSRNAGAVTSRHTP